MVLTELRTLDGTRPLAVRCMELIRALYPICRTIAGPTVRRTLDLVGQSIPLERIEVPSGTPLFDWEIPREWIIRDAYVATADGRRVVDFRSHNLHVVNYSVPVRRTMTLDELNPHLHSDPEHPEWIPYRTGYYKDQWGFCLAQRTRDALGPGPYEVVIDAEHQVGSLTYGECVVPGTSRDVGIVYTHTCHPSLANDNLTGIAVAVALAEALLRAKPRLTWRFIFGPGTIGSLAWLARNETILNRVKAGLTLGLLGDERAITYKCSRRGDTMTDRVASYVLERSGLPRRVDQFEPYGYDERQFCSPGFDLPVGRLSRARYGEYPEYHTSADDISLISEHRLAESIAVAANVVGTLDANRRLLNLSPKGEPRLGKRGLYGQLGGRSPGQVERALLWVMSYSDGRHDLLDIAQLSGIPFSTLEEAAGALERVQLVRDADEHPTQGAFA